MASVTTIDEINMGFELAILAGQEAMLEESSEEGKTSPWQAREQCKTRTSSDRRWGSVKLGHAQPVCLCVSVFCALISYARSAMLVYINLFNPGMALCLSTDHTACVSALE